MLSNTYPTRICYNTKCGVCVLSKRVCFHVKLTKRDHTVIFWFEQLLFVIHPLKKRKRPLLFIIISLKLVDDKFQILRCGLHIRVFHQSLAWFLNWLFHQYVKGWWNWLWRIMAYQLYGYNVEIFTFGFWIVVLKC